VLSEKEEYTEACDSRLLFFNNKTENHSENLLNLPCKSNQEKSIWKALEQENLLGKTQ